MGVIPHSIPDEPSERDLPFVDVYHPMDEVMRTFDSPVGQKTLVDLVTAGCPAFRRGIRLLVPPISRRAG